jgi:hypothetical protein
MLPICSRKMERMSKFQFALVVILLGRLSSAEELPAFAQKKAPPLPPPTGPVIAVTNVEELFQACGKAAEGSTIFIADGTYFLPDLLRLRGLRNVTLRGKSGDRTRVILDGSRSKSRELLWIEASEGVTVADLTVQNAPVHAITVKGESNVQRPAIYNCSIRNFWERGIKGTAPFGKDGKMATQAGDEAALKVRPRGGSIRYCLFQNDHPKTEGDWTGGDYIGGIDMMWLEDFTISDNVFIGIQGKNQKGRGAVFIWNNSERVTVERNLVVGCDTGLAFGNPSGGARHMTGGILRSNFIVRGSYKAIELARTASCEVSNNTVWSEDEGWDRTFHIFQGQGGTRVFNNLVRGKILIQDPDCKVDGNLSGPLDGFFVNPKAGDLHLTAEGAAACAGKGLAVPAGSVDFDGQPRTGSVSPGADQPAQDRR